MTRLIIVSDIKEKKKEQLLSKSFSSHLTVEIVHYLQESVYSLSCQQLVILLLALTFSFCVLFQTLLMFLMCRL